MAKFLDDLLPRRQEKRDGRPNVLIIMTDQQRADSIHALGAQWMQTPNMDRLVNEGCSFINACTCNPVCIPARHSLLTGLYSRDHGAADNQQVKLPADMPRLPQIMADAGWRTEAIGKMHFTPAQTHHGFHKMQTQEELYTNRGDDDYAMWLVDNGLGHVKHVHGIRNPLGFTPQRSQLDPAHHPTTWVGNRTVDAIKRNTKRPFFMWSSFIHPHYPCAVPDAYADMYKGADIPAAIPPQENVAERIVQNRKSNDYDDAAKDQRMREMYYACISMVDEQVGRILKALEETNQLNNTLIIFTSDHGDMLNDNGAWGKSVPYDSARKIPLLMRYPKTFNGGSTFKGHADLIDVLPTILDVCDLSYDAPYTLPGQSVLVPKEQSKNRDVHYMENGNAEKRVISIRGHRYKYNYWFGDGREEFFDRKYDPQECNNLIGPAMKEKYQRRSQSMKAELISLEKRFGHADSFNDDGTLKVYNKQTIPDWPPCQAGIDFQMPRHFWNASEEERALFQSDLTEFRKALKQEPSVDVKRINWQFYMDCGGEQELLDAVEDGSF